MYKEYQTYTPFEENLNIWSHFSGLLLSIVGMFLLLKKGIDSHQTLEISSYVVYGFSMIVLYLASTLYHSAKDPIKRARLNKFDHMAIYLLIAGTYTPFTLLVLKGTIGWTIFGISWSVGIIGMILKLFFTGKFRIASTIGYVVMGWLVIFAIKPLIHNFNAEGLILLLAGGVFYTFGAVLYAIKSIPYNHAIFHFFVLGGSICHFAAVYFCI